MDLDASIRGLMTDDVQTIAPSASLSDAWTLMLNGGYRHLPVCKNGELVGLLSSADLMAELKGQPDELRGTGVVLDERTVADLMTPEVRTVSLDARIRDAVFVFAEGRLHSVPVVAGTRLVGIVTTADLAQGLLSEG